MHKLLLIAAAALGLAASLPAHAQDCSVLGPKEMGTCLMDKIIRLPADGTPRVVEMGDHRPHGCFRRTADGGTQAAIYMSDPGELFLHRAVAALLRCSNGKLERRWLSASELFELRARQR